MHFQEKKKKSFRTVETNRIQSLALTASSFWLSVALESTHGEESSIISGVRALIACGVPLSLLLFQFQIGEF